MRAPWELRTPAGSPWIAVVIRSLLLFFCTVLALLGRGSGSRVGWLLVLLLVGVGGALLRPRRGLSHVLAVLEAALAAVAVAYTGGSDSPLLAYLPAASFGAGLALGATG